MVLKLKSEKNLKATAAPTDTIRPRCFKSIASKGFVCVWASVGRSSTLAGFALATAPDYLTHGGECGPKRSTLTAGDAHAAGAAVREPARDRLISPIAPASPGE